MAKCRIETYNGDGELIASSDCRDPMEGLAALATIANENGGFRYAFATCYLGQEVQWELEIK